VAADATRALRVLWLLAAVACGSGGASAGERARVERLGADTAGVLAGLGFAPAPAELVRVPCDNGDLANWTYRQAVPVPAARRDEVLTAVRRHWAGAGGFPKQSTIGDGRSVYGDFPDGYSLAFSVTLSTGETVLSGSGPCSAGGT
jgi:hypothetical protein